MNTTLTKLSPYTLSLIGSSPPSLPHVPTLKELRERTSNLPIPDTSQGGVSIPSLHQQGAGGLPAYSFSNSPPPKYSSNTGWGRSQGLIPGEGKGRPRMKPSRSYSSDTKVQLDQQPAIGDVSGEERKRSCWKDWISWMTCRI